MTCSGLQPASTANDILKVLRAVPDLPYLPIDVKAIAIEFSRLKFPQDPITRIHGDSLPGFEGMLKKFRKGTQDQWGIIYNSDVSEGRQNYTLAHEFGHYLLHRAQSENFECSQRDMVRWDEQYENMEAEANKFASFLLMPIDDFRQQAGNEVSLDMLSHCADRYNVSMIAAAKKWIEFTPKKAMLVISRDGFILWSSSSDAAFKSGIYFKTRGCAPKPIPDLSLGAQHIENSEGQIYQPGVWWPDRAVKEMTLFSDKYDLTISLLQFYD